MLDYFLQEIWCLIQEFSSGKHKLEVMSGNEEYNPCGLGQKPREMYCDYAWLVLGNQTNFYFFLVLTMVKCRIKEEYEIPRKVKNV